MSLCAEMNPPWMLQEEVKRLTAEVEKLKADLAFADAQCAKIEGLFIGTHNENEKLRATLQRIRRWGSPMIKGYIDGALDSSHIGSSNFLVDGEMGEVRGQEEEQT
jgi:hypothetical protein